MEIEREKKKHRERESNNFTRISFVVGHHKLGQLLVQVGVQIPVHEKPKKS